MKEKIKNIGRAVSLIIKTAWVTLQAVSLMFPILVWSSEYYKYQMTLREEARDIAALAANAYYESRIVGGKDLRLKRRDMENVSIVVMNRLRSKKFGKTIPDVLLKRRRTADGRTVCQFSWACIRGLNRPRTNTPEYKLAMQVARDVYRGKVKRDLKGACHYYNPNLVRPRWARGMKFIEYVPSGHLVVD